MPSLQVRELPEHIYRTLCHEAETARRSLAQQAVAVLAKGLNLEVDPRARRRALLEAIRAGAVQTEAGGFPDPALLIREDRGR